MLRTDAMTKGGMYRFSFQDDGNAIFSGSVSDGALRSQIVSGGLPLASVEVSRPLFSDTVSVTFVWNTSGWTVQQALQNFERVMSAGLGNYSFKSGEFLGVVNPNSTAQLPSAPAGDSVLDKISQQLLGASSSTILIGVAIVLVLALGFYGWGGSGFKGLKLSK